MDTRKSDWLVSAQTDNPDTQPCGGCNGTGYNASQTGVCPSCRGFGY